MVDAVLAKLVGKWNPVPSNHHTTRKCGQFTMQLPEHDRNYRTKSYLFSRMIVALGGHLAEKLIMGDVSTGPSSDLQNVTNVAGAT